MRRAVGGRSLPDVGGDAIVVVVVVVAAAADADGLGENAAGGGCFVG